MGIEAMFGGEKYSKEVYNNTQSEIVRALNEWRDRDIAKARERLEKLYGKGQAEAITLNEEYDRLFAEAQKAVKAIEDFEKEKLGMSSVGE